MPLHIIKLSVGSEDIDDMYRWLKDSRAGRDEFSHTTRMFPRRKDEILPGGSLYWVIRGAVLCRTPIADLVPVFVFDVYTQPEIRAAADLRGGSIGITQPGATTDFAAQ